MRDHLADTFDELSATLGVRAIVLTGAGEQHFCTGAGLGGAQKPEPPRPDGRPRPGARRRRPAHPAGLAAPRRVDPRLREAGDRRRQRHRRRRRRQPRARLRPRRDGRQRPPHRGLRPARHHPRRRRLLPAPPHRRARSGPRSSCSSATSSAAADCERWGIANRVVPAADLAPRSTSWPAGWRPRRRKAVAMTKWLVNRSSESSRHAAFEEEAYAQELVTATADMAEGIAGLRRAARPPTSRAGRSAVRSASTSMRGELASEITPDDQHDGEDRPRRDRPPAADLLLEHHRAEEGRRRSATSVLVAGIDAPRWAVWNALCCIRKASGLTTIQA